MSASSSVIVETAEESDVAEDEVPDFVIPLIRAICIANDTSSAETHVLTGLKAVVKEKISRADSEPPSKRRKRTQQPGKSTGSRPRSGLRNDQLGALIVAVYCVVAVRMNAVSNEDDEYEALRKRATQAVKDYVKEKEKAGIIVMGLAKLDTNVRMYLLEAEDSGWLNTEWCKDVPEDVIEL